MTSEFILVHTTLNSREAAEKFSKEITSAKLSACSQVEGPITSFYWWQGKLEEEQEWRCTLKTTQEAYQRLEQKIKEVHPYDTPEIIVIPILRGSKDYLNWVEANIDRVSH